MANNKPQNAGTLPTEEVVVAGAGALPSDEGAAVARVILNREYKNVEVDKLNKKDLASMVHNQSLRLHKFQFMKDELSELKTMSQQLMVDGIPIRFVEQPVGALVKALIAFVQNSVALIRKAKVLKNAVGHENPSDDDSSSNEDSDGDASGGRRGPGRRRGSTFDPHLTVTRTLNSVATAAAVGDVRDRSLGIPEIMTSSWIGSTPFLAWTRIAT
jgi:hypothetical protein